MLIISKFLLLTTILLVASNPVLAQGGYAAYASGGIASESGSVNGQGIAGNGDDGAGAETVKAPVAPLAPPRVPIQPEGGIQQAVAGEVPPSTAITAGGGAPSLGYIPPPPPVRRDAQSVGKCAFDSSKWSVEPQSAISAAIMFDRTTGLTCEECLEKCIKFQDASIPWVCRSLTYDNNWKICDLYTINGTEYPFFLTQFDGRDYFAYLAALPPTDAQLNALPAATPAGFSGADRSSATATGSIASAEQSAASSGSIAASDGGISSVPSQIQPAAPEAPAPSAESPATTTASATSSSPATSSATEALAAGLESSAGSGSLAAESAPSTAGSAPLAAGSSTLAAGSSAPAAESPAPAAGTSAVTEISQASAPPSTAGAEATAPSEEATEVKAGGIAYAAKIQQVDELDSNLVKTETLQQKNEEVSADKQQPDTPASLSYAATVLPTFSPPHQDQQQPVSSTAQPSFSPSSTNTAQLSGNPVDVVTTSNTQPPPMATELVGLWPNQTDTQANVSPVKTEIALNSKIANVSASEQEVLATMLKQIDSDGAGAEEQPKQEYNRSEIGDYKSLRSFIRVIPINAGLEETSLPGYSTRLIQQLQKEFTTVANSSTFHSSSSSSSSSATSSSSSAAASSAASFNASAGGLGEGNESAQSSANEMDAAGKKAETVAEGVKTVKLEEAALAQSDLPASSHSPQYGLTSSGQLCGADEETRYMAFHELESPKTGAYVELSPANSLKECVDACDMRQLLPCSSAVFSAAGCELFTTPANHSTNEGGLKTTSKSTYLEKFCIPSKLAKGIGKISTAIHGYILVGHVQEVTDAKTLLECQLACLRSEIDYGFTCRSALWYPTDKDQNCLLNSESRTTQPEVFVNEDQGVMMFYFEMAREDASPTKNNDLAALANMRFRDSPMSASAIGEFKNRMYGKSTSDSKWTRWSLCKKEDPNAMRYRYLKCTHKKDVRKCPKESVMCKKLPPLQIQRLKHKPNNSAEATAKPLAIGECRAVRDTLGRKHCPYGMRLLTGGRREYCTQPVDC